MGKTPEQWREWVEQEVAPAESVVCLGKEQTRVEVFVEGRSPLCISIIALEDISLYDGGLLVMSEAVKSVLAKIREPLVSSEK